MQKNEATDRKPDRERSKKDGLDRHEDRKKGGRELRACLWVQSAAGGVGAAACVLAWSALALLERDLQRLALVGSAVHRRDRLRVRTHVSKQADTLCTSITHDHHRVKKKRPTRQHTACASSSRV